MSHDVHRHASLAVIACLTVALSVLVIALAGLAPLVLASSVRAMSRSTTTSAGANFFAEHAVFLLRN